jgi:hypothetical protein
MTAVYVLQFKDGRHAAGAHSCDPLALPTLRIYLTIFQSAPVHPEKMHANSSCTSCEWIFVMLVF